MKNKIYFKRQSIIKYLMIILSSFVLCLFASSVIAKDFTFSGYKFRTFRDRKSNPGPTNWSSNNAWVDSKGRLHLKFVQRNGVWYGAGIQSLRNFGYGTYTFYIESPRPDQFDKNIVLGMFQYPAFAGAIDGTHEIDIEISRWGFSKNFPVNYTVYPIHRQIANITKAPRSLSKTASPKTTHSFKRSMRRIEFVSKNASNQVYARWTFAPAAYDIRISPKTMPVLFNLWSRNGKPSDKKNVEVIITKFVFKPEN